MGVFSIRACITAFNLYPWHTALGNCYYVYRQNKLPCRWILALIYIYRPHMEIYYYSLFIYFYLRWYVTKKKKNVLQYFFLNFFFLHSDPHFETISLSIWPTRLCPSTVINRYASWLLHFLPRRGWIRWHHTNSAKSIIF